MTSAVSGLSAALYRDEPEEYVVTAALGSNRDICFVSKDGVNNSVEIVVGESTATLSVDVTGAKLTITSANTDGSATSTAKQIVDAVNADVDAAALFTARLPPGSTGAGVTGAVAELTAHDGVHFTEVNLVDSGDHKTFQAAAGGRYWTSMTKLEVDVGHDGSWVEQTSGYTVNLLRGSITLDTAIAAGDLVRATGLRRSELAFRKIIGLFDGKLKIDGKEIDTTSVDDAGWGSSITGAKSWDFSAGTFYYDGSALLTDIAESCLWKFYSVLATIPFAIGMGSIQSLDHVLASVTDAQKQTLVVKGNGEIYPE